MTSLSATRETSASRASPHAAPDPTPPVGPFGLSMAIVSLVFLAAGVAWPHSGGTLLRILLVVLALGFVVARAYGAELPERTAQDSYSPFGGHAARRTASAAPDGLRRLTRELHAADDARRARSTAIPWKVGRAVIEEVSRRLAEGHGLRLDQPAHHPHIRALVSEPTWLLIDPGDPESPPTTRWHPVPLSQLDGILDDLERL